MANSVEDRFWNQVAKSDGCWGWLGEKTKGGYGRFYLHGHRTGAHRVAWWLTHGEWPALPQIDHLCRNRACVNPAHLEPVTARENTLRGQTLPAANIVKTHCPKGHPYSESNTKWNRRGGRVCRTCAQEKTRLWMRKNRYGWVGGERTRGDSAADKNRQKTACPSGHPYTAQNTYIEPVSGCRRCRTCRAARRRKAA